MEKPREVLISAFSDGKRPTGSEFRFMIESIISRRDDGLDKVLDSPLKVMAGSAGNAPVIALCPKDVLDPQWVFSLKSLDKAGVVNGEGLNIGQGDRPSNPVVFLDKSTGHVGLGTNTPTGALEVQEAVNGEMGEVQANPHEGSGAYVIKRLRTHGGEGVLFKNSLNRVADGGPNAMTLRNDTGNLRLQAQSGVSKVFLGSDGTVGINTESPSMPVEISGHVGLAGNSLYFPPKLGTPSTLGETGIYWAGKDSGNTAAYGIYRTPGTWTGNLQQLRINFDSGIQLAAATTNPKGFVDVVSGKGLMVSAGSLGVGTTTPTAKAQVVTTAFDGDAALPSAWGTGQSVVGANNNDGGMAMGFNPTKETSYLLSGKPGVGFLDLNVRGRTLVFANAAGEAMRVNADGKVGIGFNNPSAHLHLRRDQNAATSLQVQNASAGADASVSIQLQTDNGSGVLFKNSSLRSNPDGINTMVLRNETGDLRLQSQGGNGIAVKATTGEVGIGITGPLHQLHVRKDGNARNSVLIENITAGASAFGSVGIQTDNSFGGLFKNSSLRTTDGGANAMTLRNDKGDLKLQAEGQLGMTITAATGFVAVGANAAEHMLHVRKDWDGHVHQVIQNGSAGASSYSFLGLKSDTGTGYLAKNSSTRTLEGGANALTLRNENGDLRLLANAQIGLHIAATTGSVGIATGSPLAKLHIASNGKNIAGNGLLLGKVNDAVLTGANPNDIVATTDIGFASYRDNVPNQVGAKISAIRIATYSTGMAERIQASELAFFTGDGGASLPVTSGFVETCAERLRITRDGRVGVGTATPASTMGIAGGLTIGAGIAASTAAPTNGLQVEGNAHVNGYAAANGLRVGLSPGSIGNLELVTGGASPFSGRLIFGTDNTTWRFGISKRAGTTLTDLLTVVDNGNVGIGLGNSDPGQLLDIRRDTDTGTAAMVSNLHAGPSAHTVLSLRTNTNFGYVYKNGGGRTSDGGANTMTVLNENGDLRLFGTGKVGLYVQGGTGNVAIGGGTTSPNAPLTITSEGIDYSPDGNMRIDRDTILFGGANSTTRETNSAQISAGKHQPNSLCIVGMSDENRANRRVDMWAEGGFNLNGKMRVMNTTPFLFKRFTANIDGPHIYTGFSYNDYIVAVVGFFAYGDRATNGMRALPTPPDSGRSDWKIVCDLHGPNDYYWELVVMAVRRELADFL